MQEARELTAGLGLEARGSVREPGRTLGFGGKRSCGGGMRKGSGSVYLERGVNMCAGAWGAKVVGV